MFELLFGVIVWLIQLIQPILVPVCFVLAWLVVSLAAWSLWATLRDGVANARRMHQIPCAGCQFFSGSYHLKCSVHPTIALSEDAINCPDFKPQIGSHGAMF